ncbi:MAG: glycoside hydrolase family 25 protein [Hyphomicrobiales bacterium]
MAYFLNRYVLKPAYAAVLLVGVSGGSYAEDKGIDQRVRSGDPIAKLITGSLGAKPYNVSQPVKKKRPRGKLVEGIDVSKYQGNINWKKVKAAGIRFAYIKSTEGGDHKDNKFKKNWKAAAEAGVARGAYHFYYFCTSPQKQARWFIRNVPKDKNALPPVLDMEWNHLSKTCKKRPGSKRVQKDMLTFLRLVEKHYGKRPVIYTSVDFHRERLVGALKEYPFWLRSVAAPPRKVYKGRNWLFWQWTGTGKVRGIKGKVDRNKFSGTVSEFNAWWKGTTHHKKLVRR